MAALDTVSLAILLGAVLVLAGILSSLVALRFGAPLLLVFLGIGVLAGEAGPGGIPFSDVKAAYLVGSVALALILFDGGLRTKFSAVRSVLAPSVLLATVGVLITALVTAPVAHAVLDLGWTESMLVGAVVASTDAAAVFLLINARGLKLRPRIGAMLELESGTNDPFAIFLTLAIITYLNTGEGSTGRVIEQFAREGIIATAIGLGGGRLMVLALNRIGLPQGLHAPFATIGALAIFGLTQSLHASGFLAVYLAGLVVGNRPTRAYNSIVVFLDAATWLAQIVMFVILGLLAWPSRLSSSIVAAFAIAAALMLIARPLAVMICLAPFRFSWREKLFVSWVGLRGAVGIFLASIPLLVELPKAYLYFDVAFVVVAVSLLVQGWSLGYAARLFGVARPGLDRSPRRVDLDLPGQLEKELVGYPVTANSLFMLRGLLPSWSKRTLVVRDARILTPEEAGPARTGDYLYLLAPPEKAKALDRFFATLPPAEPPDPALIGDFFLAGDVTLAALSDAYGVVIKPEKAHLTLADLFDLTCERAPCRGDRLRLDPLVLVAHGIGGGRVNVVALRLDDESDAAAVPLSRRARAQRWARGTVQRAWRAVVGG